MYSHPGLVSKVVSIPRFGFSLCSSLYMRSLSHTRQPSITSLVSPSSHHHPRIFIHRYHMTRSICHLRRTNSAPRFDATDARAQTERPVGFCLVAVEERAGEDLVRLLIIPTSRVTDFDQEMTVDISLDRFAWGNISGFRAQYRK